MDTVIDILLISEIHSSEKYVYGYGFYNSKHSDGKVHESSGILNKNRIKNYVMEHFGKNYMQVTSICVVEF